MHVLEQAALRHRYARIPRRGRELLLIFSHVVEIGALNSRDRALETTLHNLLVESNDLEQLCTAITGH